MTEVMDETRRRNAMTAEVVKYATTLQFIAGTEEAKRYMVERGVPLHVIERVLSPTWAPRRLPCSARSSLDRRHN
jgi:diphthamide synthase subunit DPH2